MNERFGLTEEGALAVDNIIDQLSSENDISQIMNQRFDPSLNTISFMKKPMWRSDQGFRED
jgi:hypoxanthine-guanine phosphoribosyltransferase